MDGVYPKRDVRLAQVVLDSGTTPRSSMNIPAIMLDATYRLNFREL